MGLRRRQRRAKEQLDLQQSRSAAALLNAQTGEQIAALNAQAAQEKAAADAAAAAPPPSPAIQTVGSNMPETQAWVANNGDQTDYTDPQALATAATVQYGNSVLDNAQANWAADNGDTPYDASNGDGQGEQDVNNGFDDYEDFDADGYDSEGYDGKNGYAGFTPEFSKYIDKAHAEELHKVYQSPYFGGVENFDGTFSSILAAGEQGLANLNANRTAAGKKPILGFLSNLLAPPAGTPAAAVEDMNAPAKSNMTMIVVAIVVIIVIVIIYKKMSKK